MRKVDILQFNKEKHWVMLQLWWSERKFPSPPLEFMPPYGAIVEINGEPVCAGFLTMTDCGAAVIGHLASDPRVPGEYRNEGLDYLLAFLADVARNLDIRILFMSTNIPSLKMRFERHNFKLTDENVSVYGRYLCHGG